ncbi:MAG: hypothetical protein FWG80_01220 [Alphaproteobacteria bacterium]|nr:hypothetical protein [Alphaproteobacteria bacterium]
MFNIFNRKPKKTQSHDETQQAHNKTYFIKNYLIVTHNIPTKGEVPVFVHVFSESMQMLGVPEMYALSDNCKANQKENCSGLSVMKKMINKENGDGYFEGTMSEMKKKFPKIGFDCLVRTDIGEYYLRIVKLSTTTMTEGGTAPCKNICGKCDKCRESQPTVIGNVNSLVERFLDNCNSCRNGR